MSNRLGSAVFSLSESAAELAVDGLACSIRRFGSENDDLGTGETDGCSCTQLNADGVISKSEATLTRTKEDLMMGKERVFVAAVGRRRKVPTSFARLIFFSFADAMGRDLLL